MAEKVAISRKIGGNRFSPEATKLAREREAKVLEYRLKKVPFHRIAEALGITKGAANKAYFRALRRIPAPFADLVRTEELESLDRIEACVWGEIIRSGQSPIEIYQGVDRLLAIKTRRSRLVGLDSPTEITLRSGAADEEHSAKARREMLDRLTPAEQLGLLQLINKMSKEVDANDGTNGTEAIDITATRRSPINT
jgi:hypothetical protein